MQIIAKDKGIYDAAIIGSGPTGDWVANTVSESGMQVALLEAGHSTNEAELTAHLLPYDFKYPGRSSKSLAPDRFRA